MRYFFNGVRGLFPVVLLLSQFEVSAVDSQPFGLIIIVRYVSLVL